MKITGNIRTPVISAEDMAIATRLARAAAIAEQKSAVPRSEAVSSIDDPELRAAEIRKLVETCERVLQDAGYIARQYLVHANALEQLRKDIDSQMARIQEAFDNRTPGPTPGLN